MVLHLLRLVFLVTVLAITVSYGLQPSVYTKGPSWITGYMLIPALLATLLVIVDLVWHGKRLQILSGLFFGVLAGLAIAFVLSLIVDLIVALFPAPPPAEYPGPGPRPPLMAAYVTTTMPTTLPVANVGRDDLRPDELARYQADMKTYLVAKDTYDAQLQGYGNWQAHLQTVRLMKLLLGAAAVFMCVSFVLQTKDDFRFVIPYVEFSKQTKGARPLVLDTSVIIDGRIADIADTRILESEVIVPRFILAELQAIADSDDKLKRNRGRRGLDVLNKLQGSDKIEIRILEGRIPAVEQAPDVDAKLVALAKHIDGRVVTNDYNLNKVAQLRGVDVININDLANALKPIVLPGEGMNVKIIKPGEEPGQGIGYLEDGTMVVAEQGRDYIGREIVITVTSVLQTSAGRMIFGRMDADKSFSRRRPTGGDTPSAPPAAPAAPKA